MNILKSIYPAVFILVAAVAAIPVPAQDGTAACTSKPYRTSSKIPRADTTLIDGSLPNERRTFDVSEGELCGELDPGFQDHRFQTCR